MCVCVHVSVHMCVHEHSTIPTEVFTVHPKIGSAVRTVPTYELGCEFRVSAISVYLPNKTINPISCKMQSGMFYSTYFYNFPKLYELTPSTEQVIPDSASIKK